MNDHHPTKLTAVIFDFDGTLAELRIDFTAMKQQLAGLAADYFSPAPLPPPIPALEWLTELAARLRAADPRAASEFVERAGELIVDIEMAAARRGSLFSFTRSMLRHLRRTHIGSAIITRNCEQAVRMVFPDLDEYCSAFLAREHVPRVKPDPDHLRRAMNLIGARPETTLMVGDHPLDIRTGRSAGVWTAGVFSGNATRHDLWRSGAHWTARDCGELLELLEAEGWLERRSDTDFPQI